MEFLGKLTVRTEVSDRLTFSFKSTQISHGIIPFCTTSFTELFFTWDFQNETFSSHFNDLIEQVLSLFHIRFRSIPIPWILGRSIDEVLNGIFQKMTKNRCQISTNMRWNLDQYKSSRKVKKNKEREGEPFLVKKKYFFFWGCRMGMSKKKSTDRRKAFFGSFFSFFFFLSFFFCEKTSF